MATRKAHPSAAPSVRQLPLVLPEHDPVPPRLPPETPILSPDRIWTTLSPTLQSQVRQTFLRIMQEVLDDDARA